MSKYESRAAGLSAAVALALGTHAVAHEPLVRWPAAPSSVGIRPNGGTVAVTSCLDDGGPGTLRSLVATVPNGTKLDMSGLTCSTITLTQGELNFHTSGLQFAGPEPDVPGGPPKLTIDAAYQGRAFHATDGTGGTTYFSNLRIVNGFVSGDYYTIGGCVFALSAVYASNSVFQNCTIAGPSSGGGAIMAVSRVTLQHSTVTGNRAIAQTRSGSPATSRVAGGGGIYVAGDLHLYDSTISGNFARLGVNGNNAPDAFVIGGGAATAAMNFGQNVVISGSTISGNGSDQAAGGIAAFGTVLVRNSTISGNSAASAGGMDLHGASVTLQNSTIAFNSAATVGGIYGPTGTMTSDSTIISNNTATGTQFAKDLAHPAGALTVNGANNLVTTWDASITFAAPPMTADPKLLPLANNGGPTLTHALPSDSPAIDAGSNVAALPFDQRGAMYPRVVNGRADIGAYEWLERIFADDFE